MTKLKISLTDEIGILEWTPPERIQRWMEKVSPEFRAELEDWMGRMLTGYISSLLGSLGSSEDCAWFRQQTLDLAKACVARSPSIVLPEKSRRDN